MKHGDNLDSNAKFTPKFVYVDNDPNLKIAKKKENLTPILPLPELPDYLRYAPSFSEVLKQKSMLKCKNFSCWTSRISEDVVALRAASRQQTNSSLSGASCGIIIVCAC